MPLPKLSIPEYELEMPITGKKVAYRPFLVKEEKLLYLAMESQDNKQMVKAVAEISEFKITAPDDEKTQVEVQVPLEQVEVQVPEGHTKKILLDGNVGVIMKYPSLDAFIQQNMSDNPTVEDIFELAAGCIDQVYDAEEVYDSFSHKEALDFLENLNSDQFAKIQAFFETMPKLSHTIEVYNPKTKVKSDVVLEGLASFFE